MDSRKEIEGRMMETENFENNKIDIHRRNIKWMEMISFNNFVL